ncbi:DUF72 domain-containing protein [Lewinella cohaerens]|uniref:DUF72 domain-containing protein n=1 Tax=Lewinella cohaerens TaxID=70995 RepID=UPI00037667A3|nr:DUF72 domain-containing protein [Lewinella cohaerens]
MKFGKLQNIENVDFTLPADPLANAALLASFPEDEQPMAVYVGCTGWSMKEWVGRWYPKGTKAKDFLPVYAKQFNTIELNTTHYRIPDPDLVAKWCSQVPDDFRFCPKLPQTISHSKSLGLGGDQLPFFWEALGNFGKKLGSCFMQLPPYYGIDRLPQLAQFLSIWPKDFPLAVEFRHESWFAGAANIEEWTEVLTRYGTTAALTDVAGRRDVLHQHLTNQQTMIRFVGNGLHPTDYGRIHAWVRQLAVWKELGLKTVYFFPHEPDNILAPDLAHYLVQYLHETTSITTRGPDPISTGPQQGDQILLF